MNQYSNLALKYSAQLGEISWHQFTLDPRIKSQSEERFNFLVNELEKNNIKPVRILELCPNDRYTMHLLSEKYSCEAYGVDISARAMKRGAEIASEENINSKFYGFACDFHNLPFENNFFDLIYVYQSVHHTNATNKLIAELSRCLKVNGLMYLMDEPVKREACIHLFEANRKESYSQYEIALQNTETLNYLTHPDGCSRPEMLFGMIENHQISLSTYFDSLEAECEVTNLILNDGDVLKFVSDLDKYFLAQIKSGRTDVKELISQTLLEKLRSTKAKFSKPEQLMGLKFPSESQIEVLSSKIYDLFSTVSDSLDKADTKSLASTFGGNISITARKIKNKYDEPPCQKVVGIINKVTELPLIVENLIIDLGSPKLPDLQFSNEPEIVNQNIFPETQWKRVNEVGNITSYVNKCNALEINVDNKDSEGALVLRYYSIANENPYEISFYINDRLIESHWICQSETRLFKYFYSEKVNSLKISYKYETESENSLTENIRIGYLQQFPIIKI